MEENDTGTEVDETGDRVRVNPRRAMIMAVEKLVSDVENAEAHGSRIYRGFIGTARRLCGRMPGDDVNATMEILVMLERKYAEITGGASLGMNGDVHSYDGLTDRERAAVIAVSLYAAAPRKSQGSGIRFGTAMGNLQRADVKHNDIGTVFHSIVVAPDVASVVHDMGRMVRRLDPSGHSLDFVRLVGNLIDFQHEDRFDDVRIGWSKDFISASEYRPPKKTSPDTTADEQK